MKLKTGLRLTKALTTHESARFGVSLRPLVRFAWWQLRRRLTARPMRRTVFNGGQLLCYPENSASNAVIYFGWPDWHEMHLLEQVLRPGDGFIDVGANVGVYSVLAATVVMPEGRVLAVEPEPTLAARLAENFRLNGLDTRDVRPVALGEAEGTVSFEIERDTVGRVVEGRQDGAELVPLRRLDDVVGPDFDDFAIGKIDVEGYELQVLRGATKLLEARRPRAWLVETNRRCEAYGSTRAELQELLASHGYSLYQVSDGGNRLLPIPHGGPYPANAFAVADTPWLLDRHPRLQIDPA